jgi:hypothetical protein
MAKPCVLKSSQINHLATIQGVQQTCRFPSYPAALTAARKCATNFSSLHTSLSPAEPWEELRKAEIVIDVQKTMGALSRLVGFRSAYQCLLCGPSNSRRSQARRGSVLGYPSPAETCRGASAEQSALQAARLGEAQGGVQRFAAHLRAAIRASGYEENLQVCCTPLNCS